MSRIWLRWSLILSLTFALPLLLLRLQPYNPQAIQNLLTTPGCPAPCFMGIQPGVTSLDAAFTRLNAHRWVARVGEDYRRFTVTTPATDLSMLRFVSGWYWSQAAPDWIDSTQRTVMEVQGGEISNLSFSTTLPVGMILVTYGVPDQQIRFDAGLNQAGRQYVEQLFYADHCMWVQTQLSPLVANRYQWPTRIMLQAPNPQTGHCRETTTQ